MVVGTGLEDRGMVYSPMSGVVVEINVYTGEEVEEGQVLLTIEAMKMQNDIHSPISGTIGEIFVDEKDRVNQGDRLILIEN